jgi:hypothetical protein
MSLVGWKTDLLVQRWNGRALARRAATGGDALI